MTDQNTDQNQIFPATNQQQNLAQTNNGGLAAAATQNRPGSSNTENRDFDWKALTVCPLFRCPLCQHLAWGDDVDEIERVECSICLTMVPRSATSPSCENSHLHSVCVMCLLRIVSLRPLLHVDDALPCPVCTVAIPAINVAYLKLIHRAHATVIPFPMRPPPPLWLTGRGSTTPWRGTNVSQRALPWGARPRLTPVGVGGTRVRIPSTNTATGTTAITHTEPANTTNTAAGTSSAPAVVNLPAAPVNMPLPLNLSSSGFDADESSTSTSDIRANQSNNDLR